jgi:hypothetical protein
MASGHVNRTNRPNTWLHRPATQREDFPCQLGAVHTWHLHWTIWRSPLSTVSRQPRSTSTCARTLQASEINSTGAGRGPPLAAMADPPPEREFRTIQIHPMDLPAAPVAG